MAGACASRPDRRRLINSENRENYRFIPASNSWFLSYQGLKSSLAISENNKKIKSCGGPGRAGPTACNDAVAPQPESLFCLITGDEMVILLFTNEYFKKKYKMQRKNRKWPCLPAPPQRARQGHFRPCTARIHSDSRDSTQWNGHNVYCVCNDFATKKNYFDYQDNSSVENLKKKKLKI